MSSYNTFFYELNLYMTQTFIEDCTLKYFFKYHYHSIKSNFYQPIPVSLIAISHGFFFPVQFRNVDSPSVEYRPNRKCDLLTVAFSDHHAGITSCPNL